MVMISGSMPKVWEPQVFPVRPKPQITSSAIKQDIVLLEQCLELFPIARPAAPPRRRRPCTGSPIKAAMVSGPSSRISASVSAMTRSTKAASLSPSSAPAVEVRDRAPLRNRGLIGQVEAGLHISQMGQARGRHGDPVVGAHTAYDFFLFRSLYGVVIVPHHLDRGVVGFRAGVREEHLRHGYRAPA